MSTYSAREAAITTATLRARKREGVPIAALTAYDATQAREVDASGAELVLVGDSLGMVVQGHDTTIPVTVDDMVYHARAVARALERALLVVDLPFLSFADADAAVASAGRLMKEAGAQMVKLECGTGQTTTVRRLAAAGIPVCGHLGLTPQSVHKMGHYRRQGTDEPSARAMLEDAFALEAGGADLVLLECVAPALAREIAGNLNVPVIGIGSGPDCDGQILVLYDVLGATPQPPAFARDFLAESGSIAGALAAYVGAVRERRFPSPPGRSAV
jgi:3-methyl-2-oxobutanoate hydroxymethyltransferase